MTWEDDRYCFACGEKNPIGMHLKFILHDDYIETSYIFKKEFQGYKNIVHGGMISLLLDEIMVNLPWQKYKQPVVSGEIKVRLKKPLEVGEKVIAKAWFEKEREKFFIIKSEVFRERDNAKIAEAESICIKVNTKL